MSEIHGNGLFADQMIGANHSIIEFVGDVIDWDEYQVRKEQYEAEGIAEKYFMALGDDESYIDGTINGNESRYINHSCEVSKKVIVITRPIFNILIDSRTATHNSVRYQDFFTSGSYLYRT